MTEQKFSVKPDPLLVGNILYTGGRRLVGFYVRVYNRPGALADIAQTFKKQNLNIWTIVFGARVEIGSVTTGYIVADFTDSTVSPESVKRELEALDVIVEVKVVEPQYSGVLADLYHFPLVDDAGGRYVMLSERNMEGIVVRLRERFGTGGLAFLYHQGLIVGETLKGEYMKIGAESLKDAIRLLLIHALTTGRYRGELTYFSYGTPTLEDLIIIRIYDNWECVTAKKHGINEPASHYERGVIAGLLHAYTGREVSVEEAKCIAIGNPHCEFRVTFR